MNSTCADCANWPDSDKCPYTSFSTPEQRRIYEHSRISTPSNFRACPSFTPREPANEPLTCKGCVDAVDGKPCDAISCIRGSWLGLADHYRRKPEGMVNDTLEKELAEANRVKRDAINELCHKCGRYCEVSPMIDNTLKACPFCGGKAELFQASSGRWLIFCRDKTCAGYSTNVHADTCAIAISAWNRRAEPATPLHHLVTTDA